MKMDKSKLTKNQKKIRKDLIDQLKAKGLTGGHFTDLVDDYMFLFVTKERLQKDIDERGVKVYYNNGGGQSGYKKNDSCDLLLKYNQQMIKLLEYLGIKPSENIEIGDEDDDL